jgi:hypothetical protein
MSEETYASKSKPASKDVWSTGRDFQHTAKTYEMNIDSISAKSGSSMQTIGLDARSKEKSETK